MMKVYKVLTEGNIRQSILFVVDSLAEVERLYHKHYPEGSEIIVCELITGEVINQWAQ